MQGEQLTRFCEAVCQAICKGHHAFTFEGERYQTTNAKRLTDAWITEEEEEKKNALLP